MKILKTTLMICIVVILASCATPNKKILNPDSDKVLVLSGFPDTFYINVIGTTIFTNHNEKLENLGFEVNNLIVDIVNTSYPDSKFVTYKGENKFEFLKGNWYTGNGFRIKDSIQKFKEINSTYNARYILLIGPEISSDSIFFTNQFFKGYGITKRYLYGNPRTVLYSSMKMALIDTETYKVVKNLQFLETEDTNLLRNEKIHVLKPEDFNVFKDSFPIIFKNAIVKLINLL